MRKFKSILVANRGEIAVRIMRTAQSLGYRTIAVFSEADAAAPHVQMADDAVLIGPAPVGESYLDMDRILEAAKTSGADAVHPGYGFLAENADFAKACAKEGLVFIGPRAEAIELMGNKAEAKRRMIGSGVHCVPGYEGEDQSDPAMIAAAEKIGFPIMVKAAAGGGGRGMRLVEASAGLPGALAAARSEALNAFGSDELILEKAIVDPRHVEVQVFADSQGTVIHLGERDCSVQRRHQKVVEEAPCPVMTGELRDKMGAAAVEAARSIKYLGAGTVEFLLDTSGEFYFLEMNTRLQVEHPVTELVTGLDLVALQIKVAEGQPLGLQQDDISLTGHAIEVRLYAEDPAQDFLPVTGKIDYWKPAEGEGVRIDSGVQTGFEISPFYDPMIAKVIAYGPDRETARHRLVSALEETALFGTRSNKGFLIDILEKERFAKGEATTAFIGQEFSKADLENASVDNRTAAMAAVLQYSWECRQSYEDSLNVSTELLNWSSGGLLVTRYVYDIAGEEFDLLVTPDRDGTYIVTVGDDVIKIDLLSADGNAARLALNGRRLSVLYSTPSTGIIDLETAGRNTRFRNNLAFAAAAEEATGGGRVVAPMHGSLLEVFVKPGDKVAIGTRLAVLEAMKMQHDILAEIDGTVQEVAVSAGTQVAADELLVEIEAA